MSHSSIEVIVPGPLATIQDLGRPGLEILGVVRSGAADRLSLVAANRLVGNRDGDAAIEITLGGFVARFERDAVIAMTGAACDVSADGKALQMNTAIAISAGAKLRIGNARAGLRIYLAIQGGIGVPLVLGSRSTDLLAGVGPAPLTRGDHLRIAEVQVPADKAKAVIPPPDIANSTRDLSVVAGPRSDWFVPGALRRLCEADYVVTAQSNRTALRLSGARLERRTEDELPPEALIPGAIQIPPSGEPIVFLVDHPSTGGYPVIAVLREAALAVAAQVRPGQQVRFRLD